MHRWVGADARSGWRAGRRSGVDSCRSAVWARRPPQPLRVHLQSVVSACRAAPPAIVEAVASSKPRERRNAVMRESYAAVCANAFEASARRVSSRVSPFSCSSARTLQSQRSCGQKVKRENNKGRAMQEKQNFSSSKIYKLNIQHVYNYKSKLTCKMETFKVNKLGKYDN